MKIIVTGGCGFIGSEFLRFNSSDPNLEFLNIDSLTYAADIESLSSISSNSNYNFIHLDIIDYEGLNEVFRKFIPDKVIHFAAESHVDNSILNSDQFINTNILGTHNILKAIRNLSEKKDVHLHHISTDEVFGDLGKYDEPFSEKTPYNPSSPYSSTKAASDHLVRAWGRTFDIKYTISNCSNNYGPYQHAEKLIPTIIRKAIKGDQIPIYGDGSQIRDWLYVTDHIKAINSIIFNQKSMMQTFCIGGNNEIKNIDLCNIILEKLSKKYNKDKDFYKKHITYVDDRPGHDTRYAINNKKINELLDWYPCESFETGIEKTVNWYIEGKL